MIKLEREWRGWWFFGGGWVLEKVDLGAKMQNLHTPAGPQCNDLHTACIDAIIAKLTHNIRCTLSEDSADLMVMYSKYELKECAKIWVQNLFLVLLEQMETPKLYYLQSAKYTPQPIILSMESLCWKGEIDFWSFPDLSRSWEPVYDFKKNDRDLLLSRVLYRMTAKLAATLSWEIENYLSTGV